MTLTKRARTRSGSVAVVLLSAILLSGCHSMTRVALPGATPPPPNAAVFAQLKSGDHVRVTMQTGAQVTFTVSEVQTEGLLAEGGRHIPFRDMAQIEKRHISWTKIGILTGSILAFLIYVAANFGG